MLVLWDLSGEDPLRRKAPRLMDDMRLLDRIQYACHIDDEDTNTNTNTNTNSCWEKRIICACWTGCNVSV